MLLKDLLDEIDDDDGGSSMRRVTPAEALDPDSVVARACAEQDWRAAGRYESIPAPARKERPGRRQRSPQRAKPA